MGALTRLRNYFLGWWKQKDVTYDYFSRQFPVDLYGMVPGLTVSTTHALAVGAWNVLTTYSAGDNVTFGGNYYFSLIGGNLGNQPDISPAQWQQFDQPRAPDFSGDQDGELYLSNDIPSFQTVWIWQGGTWWSVNALRPAGPQGPPGTPNAKYDEDADSTGLYREVTGGIFPSAITWWTSAAKVKKVKEILITRDPNQTPTQIVFKFYNSAGALFRTETDVITNSGVFEVSRARTIT